MDIAQEMLTTFNYDSDLLKKVITGDESWVYGYDIETKAQSYQWKRPENQDRKKHVKFGQMWRFCSLFSSIVMAWCSCILATRSYGSIRNTTLKLYTDCAMQFVRKAQYYGKTNHGKKNHNQPPSSYSPDLAPADFFLYPKTEDTHGRKAFYYDWGDKIIIETGAVGDTEKRVSEVFRGVEKRWHLFFSFTLRRRKYT